MPNTRCCYTQPSVYIVDKCSADRDSKRVFGSKEPTNQTILKKDNSNSILITILVLLAMGIFMCAVAIVTVKEIR